METEAIHLIVLGNGLVLISKLEQLNVEYGMADCLLTDPYIVSSDGTLSKWIPHTDQTTIPIKSDSILTILDPSEVVLQTYLKTI